VQLEFPLKSPSNQNFKNIQKYVHINRGFIKNIKILVFQSLIGYEM